ncbi:rod shape-determining protein MreC [Thermocatellispora tengchongensis]|uniref:rod shape-determining protein MreC n=1 Tax=Thermocatellispora tengchongensis TaxID=1073253 RepID=UPI0031E7F21F
MRLFRPSRLLAVLVVACAVLITLDMRGHASVLRGLGAAVTGPAEHALAAAARPVTGLAGAGDAQSRVRELERRNAQLAAELWAERAAREREERGGAVRAAHPRLGLVTAAVAAARGHTVTIDAGTRDGVAAGMGVVTGDGLAGRVVQAGPAVATVLLPTAPAGGVGVRMAETGEIGTVTGAESGHEGLLRLRLLDADARLAVGQRVETLGSAGWRPYAPGVPVGTVVAVDPPRDPLARTALVRPAAALTRLDVVGVITAAGKGARDDAG